MQKFVIFQISDARGKEKINKKRCVGVFLHNLMLTLKKKKKVYNWVY